MSQQQPHSSDHLIGLLNNPASRPLRPSPHPHRPPNRPCPSTNARLWDRLLMVSEMRNQHPIINPPPPVPTSTRQHHSTRRRSNAKTPAAPPPPPPRPSQHREPGYFTFAPRDPGDHHLQQSFERALIHDGLHVSADFKLLVEVPPDKDCQEKGKKKGSIATARAKRARGVSTSSIIPINKTETEPPRRKSNQYHKRTSIHVDDDDDDGVLVHPPRPADVIPLSKLPPSDLPLIRMKERALSRQEEENIYKPYKQMSVRERLLADQRADQEKNLESASNGVVGGTANNRYVYSGSYRVSESSPAAKRRLSKTARTKNNQPSQSKNPPPESDAEKEIVVVDDDDDDDIQPINRKQTSSKSKALKPTSQDQAVKSTRRRKPIVLASDDEYDEEVIGDEEADDYGADTLNGEDFKKNRSVSADPHLRIDDAQLEETILDERKFPTTQVEPNKFVPAEDVLWITQPPSPPSEFEKEVNPKPNQIGKRNRKNVNMNETNKKGQRNNMRSRIYYSSEDEEEELVDPRDGEWHPDELNPDSRRSSRKYRNDSTRLRRSKRSQDKGSRYLQDDEVLGGGRRSYKGSKSRRGSRVYDEDEDSYRNNGRRGRKPRKPQDDFSHAVEIINEEEYDKYFNISSETSKNRRKRKRGSATPDCDYDNEEALEVHVSGVGSHFNSRDFPEDNTDDDISLYKLRSSGGQPRRAFKKRKLGDTIHINSLRKRSLARGEVKNEPSADVIDGAGELYPGPSSEPNGVKIGVVPEAYELSDTEDDVPLSKFKPIPVIVIDDDDDDVRDANGNSAMQDDIPLSSLNTGKSNSDAGARFIASSIQGQFSQGERSNRMQRLDQPLVSTGDLRSNAANENGWVAQRGEVFPSCPANGPSPLLPSLTRAQRESRIGYASISNGDKENRKCGIGMQQSSPAIRLPPAMTTAYVPPSFSIADGMNGSPPSTELPPSPQPNNSLPDTQHEEKLSFSCGPLNELLPSDTALPGDAPRAAAPACSEPGESANISNPLNQLNGINQTQLALPTNGIFPPQPLCGKEIKGDNATNISFPKVVYPQSSSVAASAYLPFLFPASTEEQVKNDNSTSAPAAECQKLCSNSKEKGLELLPPSYYLGVVNSATNIQAQDVGCGNNTPINTAFPTNERKTTTHQTIYQDNQNDLQSKKRKRTETPSRIDDSSSPSRKQSSTSPVTKKSEKVIPIGAPMQPACQQTLLRLRIREPSPNIV